ncbi:MAG: hypothetical protein PWQ12_146 [Clostridiales bacterium]|jgi:hypothetical protein|nr:hypothetical protein [Clostridiales bacterium]
MRAAARGTAFALACIFLITSVGCGRYEVAQTTTAPTSDETTTVERVATEDDVLSEILKALRAEMRVFDVVAYHESLYSEIEAEMLKSPDSELSDVVNEVVGRFMDAFLLERIHRILEEKNPLYKSEEVDWLYDRIDTEELYELIVLYEILYYEKAHETD